MNYEVTKVESGKYDWDTLFIKVDKNIVQVPVNKDAKATDVLVGKMITVDKLYNVPLDKIVLTPIK